MTDRMTILLVLTCVTVYHLLTIFLQFYFRILPVQHFSLHCSPTSLHYSWSTLFTLSPPTQVISAPSPPSQISNQCRMRCHVTCTSWIWELCKIATTARTDWYRWIQQHYSYIDWDMIARSQIKDCRVQVQMDRWVFKLPTLL